VKFKFCLATQDGNGHPYFYEFHKNQTGDANNILMHALGQWRITRAFHDLIFHPGISVSIEHIWKFRKL